MTEEKKRKDKNTILNYRRS